MITQILAEQRPVTGPACRMSAPQRQRPRGVFVTGTDTGIGKTEVACAIAKWCRDQGWDVGVMKPVATGGVRLRGRRDIRYLSEDAQRLVQAAGAHDAWALVNPICFKEPLAPSVAADRAKQPIRLSLLLRAFRTLSNRHRLMVVEGAGGLLVPLTERYSIGDLAKRFGLPLLIVTRPNLGTLNHTLLTLRYARSLGLPVLGLVVNAARPPAPEPMERLAERTNPQTLERLGRVPLLGVLPFRSVPGPAKSTTDAVHHWMMRHLDMRCLKRALLTVDSS